MNTTKYEKGNIIVFGAEGASDILESMCKGCGYDVLRMNDKQTVVNALQEDNTKLLLFDFQTDVVNETVSLSLLAELRNATAKPIIAIVDEGKEMIRILALNAGADEILGSKESPMESLACIQAMIRLYERVCGSSCGRNVNMKMQDLEVDDNAKTVTVKGEKVDLTPTEYKILHLLLEKPGRVMSNKEIYESIWKMEPIGADNTVAVHIRHIREKIEENPQEPRYLQVVWGQGYKVG